MDASIRSRAEQLATEFAGQASTIEELNGLMRLMMKSALERMLNTEMDVHLGRRTLAVAEAFEPPAKTSAVDVGSGLIGSHFRGEEGATSDCASQIAYTGSSSLFPYLGGVT